MTPLFAVRTGLEPATPCVTGRYSNQTELPNQFFYKNFPENGTANIQAFYKSAKKINKSFYFLPNITFPRDKHLAY